MTRNKYWIGPTLVWMLVSCADEAVTPVETTSSSTSTSSASASSSSTTSSGGAGGEGGVAGQGGTGGEAGQGGAGGGQLSFVAVGSYPAVAGAGNDRVIVAEMNGDNIPDMVVFNVIGRFVSVLLGAGDGTFQQIHKQYLPMSGTQEMAIADLNSDGIRDVIVTGNGPALLVLLGNGDGTLGLPSNYGMGIGLPGTIAVVDFNGDNVSDLVIGGATEPRIYTLWGNGDGTFQPAQPSSNVSGFHFLKAAAVGDLDGDMILDVIAADSSSNNLYLFKGTGGGALQAPVAIPGQRADSIALADLTGDNFPDVVIGGSNFGSQSVGVLINNGNGTFQPMTTYAIGNRPIVNRLVDLDADGALDILATTRPGDTVVYLRNAGGGLFDPAIPIPAGRKPQGVDAADINNDLLLDLVVGNAGPGLSVLPGNGNATFQAPIEQVFGAGAAEIAIGDWDGDGTQDIVFGAGRSAAITALRGVGGGLMEPVGGFPLGDDPFRLYAGQADADPSLDLLVVTRCTVDPCSSVETLSGVGNGMFLPALSSLDTFFAEDAAAADLNGDGFLDLGVTANINDSLILFVGNGDGTLSPNFVSGVDSIAFADFNGDMVLDMAATGEFASFTQVGNGDGTFQNPSLFNLMDELTDRIIPADFNGDGYTDLMATATFNRFTIMYGVGDGINFSPAVFNLNSGSILSPVVADLDGNGWPDIAVISGGRVLIVLNDNGTLKAGPVVDVERSPSSVAIADMNGDQRLDLVVTGLASNDVTVLINQGP